MPHPPTSSASLGAAIGTATLAVGLLLLAFAGFQLWGTAMTEARAQDDLAEALAATLDRTSAAVATTPSLPRSEAELAWSGDEPGPGLAEPADAALIIGHVDNGQVEASQIEASVGGDAADRPASTAVIPIATVAPPPAPLEIGQPMARLQIPTIGVDKTVVEGTTREALRTGPGHYLGTARPGQLGNVAIAGHRTTYGAPFQDIDELQPGDPIMIETEDGVFTYRVEAQPLPGGGTSGHQIVTPEEVHVIADRGDHRLTLTACHPLYSARQRIVVTAVLDQPVQPEAGITDVGAVPADRAEPEPSAAALPQASAGAERTVSVKVQLPVVAGGGEMIDAVPPPAGLAAVPGPLPGAEFDDDLGWQPQHGAATAGWAMLSALVAAAAWMLGRLWRRVPAYLMAIPTFTLCLLTCFGHLDRLIPAT